MKNLTGLYKNQRDHTRGASRGSGKARPQSWGKDHWNNRIRVVYSDHDGGWYRVMRDENCVEDFRDPNCADSYARALRKEARASLQPQK